MSRGTSAPVSRTKKIFPRCWGQHSRHFPSENPNQCIHPEVLTGILTQSLCLPLKPPDRPCRRVGCGSHFEGVVRKIGSTPPTPPVNTISPCPVVCIREGAMYRLYMYRCYMWVVDGRVLYCLCWRVLYIVCQREGVICGLYTAGCVYRVYVEK